MMQSFVAQGTAHDAVICGTVHHRELPHDEAVICGLPQGNTPLMQSFVAQSTAGNTPLMQSFDAVHVRIC